MLLSNLWPHIVLSGTDHLQLCLVHVHNMHKNIVNICGMRWWWRHPLTGSDTQIWLATECSERHLGSAILCAPCTNVRTTGPAYIVCVRMYPSLVRKGKPDYCGTSACDSEHALVYFLIYKTVMITYDSAQYLRDVCMY